MRATSPEIDFKKATKIKASFDGQKLAIWDQSSRQSIYIWDVKSQKIHNILELEQQDARVREMIISKDNQSLIVWHDEFISLYNLKPSPEGAKKLVCTQKIKLRPHVREVDIAPNTNNLIVIRSLELNQHGSAESDRVEIVNFKNNKCLRSFLIPTCDFMRLFVDQEKIKIMTAGVFEICIWDLNAKSKDPSHVIAIQDRIRQIIKVSDKQCIVREYNLKEEFIRIYDFDSLKCINSVCLKKPSPNNSHIGFYNLDNTYFISVDFDAVTDELEFNLWGLDGNHFEPVSADKFPRKIKTSLFLSGPHDILTRDGKINSISFIPVQKDKGNWICVIKDQSVETINIPVGEYLSSLGVSAPTMAST